ncbi:Proteasome accessory factor C [Dermatophilus congolensis]|uniref:Proteasome accessory factor C n=1 Tax=Dermatophilus congolensis TaxID=1863 RepID=A0A239VM50_9MICO|nr:WYL domain-containing protein [Dermatophilus congolensis]SNV22986.1 Proteasome accessory factor C [Dermatophilus congolensis]
MSMEPAKRRLERLLTMVPWVLEHPGESVEEVAKVFGVTAAQVEKDLAVIFLCGTPGITPDVLIEADWESGEVFIRNADEISRPLRLAPDEALSLIVGLEALGSVPGLADPAVVASALEKLVEATGHVGGDDAVELARRMGVDLVDEDAARWVGQVRQALRDKRRVQLRYLNVARDEVTDRDVDPVRLEHSGAHWYLRGWCHRAQGVRTFRLDRIVSLEVLEVESVPPRGAFEDAAAPTQGPLDASIEVVLRVGPQSRWIGEYYPVVSVEDAQGSGSADDEPDQLVRLLVKDPSWVRRLVWRSGGSVRVVEPAHVAVEVSRGAQRALDYYE